MAERNAMIEKSHALPITRRAQLVGISRGALYCLPKPVSPADLALMRRIDELHPKYPYSRVALWPKRWCGTAGPQLAKRRGPIRVSKIRQSLAAWPVPLMRCAGARVCRSAIPAPGQASVWQCAPGSAQRHHPPRAAFLLLRSSRCCAWPLPFSRPRRLRRPAWPGWARG